MSQTFEIEEGVEIPSGHNGGRKTLYPFGSMKPGQSFFVPKGDKFAHPAVQAAMRWNKTNMASPFKFVARACRKGDAEGHRIFCVPRDHDDSNGVA